MSGGIDTLMSLVLRADSRGLPQPIRIAAAQEWFSALWLVPNFGFAHINWTSSTRYDCCRGYGRKTPIESFVGLPEAIDWLEGKFNPPLPQRGFGA